MPELIGSAGNWLNKLFDSTLLLARRALNAFAYADVLVLLHLKHSRLRLMKQTPGVTGYFMRPHEIERYAEQPETQLDFPYVQEAMAQGDRCFGVFVGGALAGYSWFGRDPTAVTRELRLQFPKKYIYMHHSFTLPKFRGQRLHAYATGEALQQYAEEGFEEALAIVALDNVGSLKSCMRSGFRPLGKFYMVGAMNHLLVVSARACRRVGARMTWRHRDFSLLRLGVALTTVYPVSAALNDMADWVVTLADFC